MLCIDLLYPDARVRLMFSAPSEYLPTVPHKNSLMVPQNPLPSRGAQYPCAQAHLGVLVRLVAVALLVSALARAVAPGRILAVRSRALLIAAQQQDLLLVRPAVRRAALRAAPRPRRRRRQARARARARRRAGRAAGGHAARRAGAGRACGARGAVQRRLAVARRLQPLQLGLLGVRARARVGPQRPAPVL